MSYSDFIIDLRNEVDSIINELAEKTRYYNQEERRVFIETFLLSAYPQTKTKDLNSIVDDVMLLVNKRVEKVSDVKLLEQTIELLKQRGEDECVIRYLEALVLELAF